MLRIVIQVDVERASELWLIVLHPTFMKILSTGKTRFETTKFSRTYILIKPNTIKFHILYENTQPISPKNQQKQNHQSGINRMKIEYNQPHQSGSPIV